jgi:heme-degrading monooxygenase HmoA
MFIVMFEVHPKAEKSDVYNSRVALLKTELAQIDGFIDQRLYRSLTRDGWMLSLSNWRDEKALVRWRTHAKHHGMQEKCRSEVFVDYHLRIGQLTRDTKLPAGYTLLEQRLDETEAGEGNTVVLIDAKRTGELAESAGPEAIARWLGLAPDAPGLASWEVCAAVLTPGEFVLRTSWRDSDAAVAYEAVMDVPDGARLRRVRVIRDYGMYDRREAPQFYPDVQPFTTTVSSSSHQ